MQMILPVEMFHNNVSKDSFRYFTNDWSETYGPIVAGLYWWSLPVKWSCHSPTLIIRVLFIRKREAKYSSPWLINDWGKHLEYTRVDSVGPRGFKLIRLDIRAVMTTALGFNVSGVFETEGSQTSFICFFLLKYPSNVPTKPNGSQGFDYFLCLDDVVVSGQN